MLPRVKRVEMRTGYRIWVAFDDGVSGEIDLTNELWGDVFEPLKDPAAFAQLALDPDLGTVVWPNGADLAPEFLYQKLRPSYRLGSVSDTDVA